MRGQRRIFEMLERRAREYDVKALFAKGLRKLVNIGDRVDIDGFFNIAADKFGGVRNP